jgi:transcriptional regulator with XRE-family HTH domain
MTIAPHRAAAEVAKARTLRQRLALDRLDYDREVARLAGLMSQSELSRQLRVSQPAINETVRKAEKLAPVRPGFSGATPYEIAQRYSVGELSREQLIEELSRWEYAPGQVTNGYDDLLFDVPGSFDDVVRALNDGLIDDDTYEIILMADAEESR